MNFMISLTFGQQNVQSRLNKMNNPVDLLVLASKQDSFFLRKKILICGLKGLSCRWLLFTVQIALCIIEYVLDDFRY